MPRPGDFDIDADVRSARTLPAAFYRDPRAYERQLERVFARSWQLVPAVPAAPRQVRPFTLLPGSLDEPLLLTRDEAGALHCVSNVCTHRANLVVTEEGPAKLLRCGYHGRRFGLDGRFLSMPGFEGAADFPTPADDLPALELATWGPLAFTALDPAMPFAAWIEPVRARMGWLPHDRLRWDPATSRDYVIDAHWALYCDNYLEGFHIPFVHDGLAAVIDFAAYRVEIQRWGSVQIATADGAGPVFDLPAGHPDHGARIAAYYFWLFPNLMLNFYPWGLSLNLVEPQGPARMRVRFMSHVLDGSVRATGAGADLHRVELEDEAVVASAQRGVRSRLYRGGRFSPVHEAGVHHFHRLLAASLGGESG